MMMAAFIVLAITMSLNHWACAPGFGTSEPSREDHGSVSADSQAVSNQVEVSVHPQLGPFLCLTKSITFPNRSTCWLVTHDRKLFHTADGGLTWARCSVPGANALESVFFLDPTNGWLFNDDGTCLRTEDGGANWRVVGKAWHLPEGRSVSIEDFEFVDRSFGWVRGRYGETEVLRTDDGGRTWAPFACPCQGDVAGFGFRDGCAWMSIEEGPSLCYSEDWGRTWVEMPHPGGQDGNRKVRFVTREQVWLVGGSYVFRTDDQGKTWTKDAFGGDDLNLTYIGDVSFPSPERGFAVGTVAPKGGPFGVESALALVTRDNGHTWSRIAELPEEMFFERVHFSDDKHGWLVSKYTVFRTDNGGVDWVPVFKLRAVRSVPFQ